MNSETIQTFEINLNIHYSTSPDVWEKLEQLYTQMPHWCGIKNGCPQWYGEEKKKIVASVESGGLNFYAELPESEWNEWKLLFCKKATEILGYEVGEPEEGFDFVF